DVHIGREEFEQAAGPALNRTVEVTRTLLRRSAVSTVDIADVLLVGGSTRVPLVATLLHRGLQVAPTAREQPELVGAEGALCPGDRPAPGTTATPAGAAAPPRREVFRAGSGVTGDAARHAFVAFAIAVAVYWFTSASSEKLAAQSEL